MPDATDSKLVLYWGNGSMHSWQVMMLLHELGVDYEARRLKLMGIREAIADLKVRHIVSPRGSSKGIKMLRHGFPMKAVMEMVVWQGLDRDTVKKIQKHEAVTSVE